MEDFIAQLFEQIGILLRAITDQTKPFSNEIAFTLACYALLENVWASTHARPKMRSTYRITSIFNLIYVIGYAYLIFAEPSVELWSQTLRPVSWGVWIWVWGLPARKDVRLWKAEQRAAEQALQRQAEKLREDIGDVGDL